MYVIMFNGPPRSGKDTAAKMLLDYLDTRATHIPAQIRPLSMPMRRMGFAALGMNYSVAEYERLKDVPLAAFTDSEGKAQTLRQFMISLSEEFMKPKFGPDIWARLLVESTRLNDIGGLLVIPDLGFPIEYDFMIREYGANNVAIVQVHRLGLDFSNDSRQWVNGQPDVGEFVIVNDGSLRDLENQVAYVVTALERTRGWKF